MEHKQERVISPFFLWPSSGSAQEHLRCWISHWKERPRVIQPASTLLCSKCKDPLQSKTKHLLIITFYKHIFHTPSVVWFFFSGIWKFTGFLLPDHHPVLPDGLKTILLYTLPSFPIVLGKRINPILATPS